MKKLFGMLLICSGLIATDSNEVQAGCTVYLTDYESNADYVTYLTEYDAREKNAGIIKGCKLNEYEGSATYKIYLTEYESRAKIVIHRKNFPR